MADKLACTELACGITPSLRTKQVYASYDSPGQFSLASLPRSFALKPNHASGLYRLVLDKSHESEDEIKTVIAKWLRLSYYRASQEPGYRDIQAKVFAEELTLSATGFLPDEFRLFCFHGKVEFVEYEFGDTMDQSIFVDRNWKRLNVRYKWQAPVIGIPKPTAFEQAVEIAERLAAGFDFIRIDLYDLEGELVFNEVAHSPWGGLVHFKPENADQLLGAYWISYSTRAETLRNCVPSNEEAKDFLSSTQPSIAHDQRSS